MVSSHYMRSVQITSRMCLVHRQIPPTDRPLSCVSRTPRLAACAYALWYGLIAVHTALPYPSIPEVPNAGARFDHFIWISWVWVLSRSDMSQMSQIIQENQMSCRVVCIVLLLPVCMSRASLPFSVSCSVGSKPSREAAKPRSTAIICDAYNILFPQQRPSLASP